MNFWDKGRKLFSPFVLFYGILTLLQFTINSTDVRFLPSSFAAHWLMSWKIKIMADVILKYYTNYYPIGDILAVAMAIVFVILIRRAYISKTKTFFFLRFMIYILALSALSNVTFHVALDKIGQIPNILIYIPKTLYHMGMFTELWLYVLYTREAIHLDRKSDRKYVWAGVSGFAIILIYEIVGTITHKGFYIEDGVLYPGIPIFPLGYLYFITIILIMVFRYSDRIYKQVVRGVVEATAVSLGIMIIQQIHSQSSFTTATFLFPLYALLYLVHSNPYDIETGSVSEGAFEELVTVGHSKKTDFYFMSMYMPDFDGKGRKYPREIQRAVRVFATKFFRQGTLFQITGGHMILCVETKKNPGYLERAQWMLDEFFKVYPIYKIDYKIVFMGSQKILSENNDYIGFLNYMHDTMEINSVVKVDEKQISDYVTFKYIVKELKDINEKADLDDPSVLVYCQPVYNIRTGKFDTAEALMRLVLPNTGMVFPDIFIPIAEKNDYIGTLTRIILAKTSAHIRKMLDEGYNVKRISVNFSVYDVRQEDFCEVVEKIISRSEIPFEKIAIEITESQNEQDFEVIKTRINELKGSGIKFYLDDFGTGYSNFERIMELPFDIVKFDRSLVIASGNDERFRTMVSNLARMFREVHYSVLYEGIENEEDEKRCIDMSAKYLQGYKYSKPIPIERLSEYFEKIS